MKAAVTILAIGALLAANTSCINAPPGDTYASEGERLYAVNCTRCHRQPEQFSNLSNESLRQAITKGAHRMPAFPDITPEEQQQIIAYIRNL
ncbi:MAG: cytochrome c [Gammaproteobacteria bacterium]|jgi:mono/diheme cytochrome c family protein